jgi:hypothetical protein
MNIHLINPATDKEIYVSSVTFKSGAGALEGEIWTSTPGPQPGDYLLRPFGFRIKLMKPDGEDNHSKFITITGP